MDAVLKLYISDTELSKMCDLEKQNYYGRYVNYTEMVKGGVYKKIFSFFLLIINNISLRSHFVFVFQALQMQRSRSLC